VNFRISLRLEQKVYIFNDFGNVTKGNQVRSLHTLYMQQIHNIPDTELLFVKDKINFLTKLY